MCLILELSRNRFRQFIYYMSHFEMSTKNVEIVFDIRNVLSTLQP